MQEGTLPFWALLLIAGVILNIAMGMNNPYVPKELQKQAKLYREKGEVGPRPIIEIHCRVSGFAYICFTAIILLAASVVFFATGSFIDLVNAMRGGILGSLAALAFYVVCLVISALVLVTAAVIGEMIEYDSVYRYYTYRYDAIVQDRRDEVERKTPH